MRILVAVFFALALLSTSSGAEDRFIILQSTTSTANSGLLDYLAPKFKEQSGIELRVVAVGTGQALKNAGNGDGDVLLVHTKAREEMFVSEGFGVKRHDIMYNDFVIVGPANDPADIAGLYDITLALKKIANAKIPFASRGDESGTHIKEVDLWKEAGIDAASASGTWYRETGSGMGTTLNIATGMNAYTMTDRATWVAFANKRDFRIMVEGDRRLFNQYGAILVNPERHAHIKAADGQAFVDWLISPEGQLAIASFKRDKQQLFFPNANQ